MDDLSSEIKLRHLKDLYVTTNHSAEAVAENISVNLSEANKDLLVTIAVVLGNEKAISFYNETKHIEETGGMLTANGTRRKTPGGIFFHLVKQDVTIPKETLKEIFSDTSLRERQKKNKEIKERRRQKNLEVRARLIREGLLTTLQENR